MIGIVDQLNENRIGTECTFRESINGRPVRGKELATVPKMSEKLLELAQLLANRRPGFFDRLGKGPGLKNGEIRQFVSELRSDAELAFGADYAKRKICGDNNLDVDFWFPEESVIVEVILIRNPLIQYEHSIIKALMAIDMGYTVARLILLSNPFARRSFGHPNIRPVIKWALDQHALAILVHEIEQVGCPGRQPR